MAGDKGMMEVPRKIVAITKDHCPKCINAKERLEDYSEINWINTNSYVGQLYVKRYGIVVAPTFLIIVSGSLLWQTTSVLEFEKFIKGE